jgi:hypothetical protein
MNGRFVIDERVRGGLTASLLAKSMVVTLRKKSVDMTPEHVVSLKNRVS